MNNVFIHLFLVLEVYQFARDAAVAEAWLIAQEPYLMSTELGVSYIFENSACELQDKNLFSSFCIFLRCQFLKLDRIFKILDTELEETETKIFLRD